jgi:hypothetical protein
MRVLLAAVKCVNYLCLCAYCVNLLSALDSNDVGFSEEGETCCISNPSFTYCMLYKCL